MWLNDLARHNLGRGNDAVRGGAQHLKAGAGIPSGFTARPQPLEFAFEVIDLTLWHRASFRQWPQASQLILRDRYQLFDLADFFQDCGAVGDRQMRLNLDENVALADRLSDTWNRALIWNDAAAIDALHDAAAVWIGNDAANQIERRAYRLRFGDSRADIQQALGRLGRKGGTVLQASRRIAESSCCGRACVADAVSVFAD